MRSEWSTEDLVAAWTPVGDDWRLVGNKTGSTRLGFALVLKFFEIEARFPRDAAEFPDVAVNYVASQVKVDASELQGYPWSGRSAKYHREQIRDVFGFREFTRADEDKLTDWLATEVCPVELRDEQLREALMVRCRAERIEPPGRVDRIIGAARASFEQRFCERTLARLGDECAHKLEELASGDLLVELKADPGQVGLESLLKEIDKLTAIRGTAAAGRFVCRRVGQAGASVASARGPLLPVGSAGDDTTDKADAAGRVVLGAFG